MTPELREATVDDLEAVMRLEVAGFEPGIVEDAEVFDRRLRAFPEGFLLAGSPPWGYLCAELWDDAEPTAERFDLGHDIARFHRPTGRVLYVASMTVAPEVRGSGRGRRLFRGAVEHLRRRFPQVDTVVLIVNEHWKGAVALYEAEGLRQTGRLEAFFRPSSGAWGDALIYQKH